jgi:hypothetical protein
MWNFETGQWNWLAVVSWDMFRCCGKKRRKEGRKEVLHPKETSYAYELRRTLHASSSAYTLQAVLLYGTRNGTLGIKTTAPRAALK